jgi:2,3-bisphosphoglycerate-independent phosphoglycerate mutase
MNFSLNDRSFFMDPQKPVMLMILDGWGYRPQRQGNAVAQADMPFLNELLSTYPVTQLQCAGEAVGLPQGIMGNSEVGHLNIGAGRIVYQDLLRIDRAIGDGSFFKTEALQGCMSNIRQRQSALHLMGLVSDGGVHSQLTHVFALLDLARQQGLTQVYVHVILDGRDTPPDSGVGYAGKLQEHLKTIGVGRIATICGRYYAMDRDTRWDRVEQAYRLYTQGQGLAAGDPLEAIQSAYRRGESDEFVKPIAITGTDGRPLAMIQDQDGIIFFNFRADRAREITRAFTDPAFDGFRRPALPKLCDYVCMTLYDEHFNLPVAFPPNRLEGILGEVISQKGLRQLRIAETEKYAHVTYFFNGGEEKPFAGEDRCLIPSPRDVATYDMKPEMSAAAVTQEVLARIGSQRYDLMVLNFANLDMVGHTGVMAAAMAACRTVDRCVAAIVTEVRQRGGLVLITADHGNAETMVDENGNPHTAHTTNPVRLILVDDRRRHVHLREGILGDIAPTILDLMGIEKSARMTGRSLLER